MLLREVLRTLLGRRWIIKFNWNVIGPPGRCPDRSKKIWAPNPLKYQDSIESQPHLPAAHNAYISGPRGPVSLSSNEHLPRSHLQLSAFPRSTPQKHYHPYRRLDIQTSSPTHRPTTTLSPYDSIHLTIRKMSAPSYFRAMMRRFENTVSGRNAQGFDPAAMANMAAFGMAAMAAMANVHYDNYADAGLFPAQQQFYNDPLPAAQPSHAWIQDSEESAYEPGHEAFLVYDASSPQEPEAPLPANVSHETLLDAANGSAAQGHWADQFAPGMMPAGAAMPLNSHTFQPALPAAAPFPAASQSIVPPGDPGPSVMPLGDDCTPQGIYHSTSTPTAAGVHVHDLHGPSATNKRKHVAEDEDNENVSRTVRQRTQDRSHTPIYDRRAQPVNMRTRRPQLADINQGTTSYPGGQSYAGGVSSHGAEPLRRPPPAPLQPRPQLADINQGTTSYPGGQSYASGVSHHGAEPLRRPPPAPVQPDRQEAFQFTQACGPAFQTPQACGPAFEEQFTSGHAPREEAPPPSAQQTRTMPQAPVDGLNHGQPHQTSFRNFPEGEGTPLPYGYTLQQENMYRIYPATRPGILGEDYEAPKNPVPLNAVEVMLSTTTMPPGEVANLVMEILQNDLAVTAAAAVAPPPPNINLLTPPPTPPPAVATLPSNTFASHSPLPGASLETAIELSDSEDEEDQCLGGVGAKHRRISPLPARHRDQQKGKAAAIVHTPTSPTLDDVIRVKVESSEERTRLQPTDKGKKRAHDDDLPSMPEGSSSKRQRVRVQSPAPARRSRGSPRAHPLRLSSPESTRPAASGIPIPPPLDCPSWLHDLGSIVSQDEYDRRHANQAIGPAFLAGNRLVDDLPDDYEEAAEHQTFAAPDRRASASFMEPSGLFHLKD
ncbi:hypothetical protein CALVIDRAFT_600455 [Calocera viscosa TUFC12733]|uniref:Uncharacterized protein n=1 Tax=Calocera viscosa (strain TUFC12733) TaxID=1330018 RepID=A0A167JMN2_CALVF|nr:hypothetical protein CALVIDRAFT_600455 [Calocera viscosa TUFC12733]